MKYSFFTAVTIFVIVLLPLTSQSETTPGPLSTNYLISNGWTIIEKSEGQELLPGVAPYQDLKRILQITHYRLQKGTALMKCKTAYDSQLDQFEESCLPISK